MALKISPVTLTTSLATIYTCPVGTEASAHGVVFSNYSPSDVTVSMTFYKASNASTTTLADGITVKAEGTFAWPRPLNMGAGDYIQAKASAGTSCSLAVSVYEGTTVAIGFTVQGTWSNTTPYNTNDVVSYNGASYAAIQPSTNQNPSTATTYWALLSAAGTAATIAVGTTTTGAAGSSASVTNSGSSSAAVFNFTIPRGDTGATGSAATVAVGTTTTGAAGSSASVTNSGSSSAAIFNFTIPRGDTGATGATGPTGPKSITIGTPVTGDSITLFYTPVALTISSVFAVVTGSSTPTVPITINSATARNSGSPIANVNSQSVTSLAGASVTVANASIGAGSWVWLNIGTVSGTVTTANVTLNFS